MAKLSEKRKHTLFAAGFVLLIALSMDVWNWTSGMPFLLGMPFWVIWDIIVVILIGLYYLLFCAYFWRD